MPAGFGRSRVEVLGCRVLAELRRAPSLALIPLSYGFDNRRPSQRALASDARGRRSGRRPCVCLVLSSSAGARCAVVSSNATLFPPLEHSAGRTWHRREHALVCRLSAPLRQATVGGRADTTNTQQGRRLRFSLSRTRLRVGYVLRPMPGLNLRPSLGSVSREPPEVEGPFLVLGRRAWRVSVLRRKGGRWAGRRSYLPRLRHAFGRGGH